MNTFTVSGSWGELLVDAATGNVIKYDNQGNYITDPGDKDYRDITRFDIAEWLTHYKAEGLAGASLDILDIGFWEKDGTFTPPEPDHRDDGPTQMPEKPTSDGSIAVEANRPGIVTEATPEPDPNSDEFKCEQCGEVKDIEESVRLRDQTYSLICDHCHNIVARIEAHMRTDDDQTDQSYRLRDLYNKATPEQRALLDDALICICGYSLTTIINGEDQ